MASVQETIANAIAYCRESGIEPNRVKMSAEIYRQLYHELKAEKGEELWGADTDIPVTFGEIQGLKITIGVGYPPSFIRVDRECRDDARRT